MRVLALIPARGGSKGIPGKNIKKFNNKPLIYWTINNCLNNHLIDDVYVSSDSEDILNIAIKYKAKIIKRPKNISGDKASSESAVLHAINNINKKYDYVVLVEPTNPLKKNEDIDRALKKMKKENLDSLFSATQLIDFMFWKKDNKIYKSFNYNYKKRGIRQGREDNFFLENGNFYIFKPNIIKKYNNRLGGKIGVFLSPIYQYAEIDDISQWNYTEMLHRYLLNLEKD